MFQARSRRGLDQDHEVRDGARVPAWAGATTVGDGVLRGCAHRITARHALADPVREIVFTFYNDALYQVLVTYDRDRTEGLTNRDIIDSISAVYGMPGLASARSGASRPLRHSPVASCSPGGRTPNRC